jgi:hypothetical protein
VLVEQQVDPLEPDAVVIITIFLLRRPQVILVFVIATATTCVVVVVVEASGLVQVIVHRGVVSVVSVTEPIVFRLKERVVEQLDRRRPP